MSEDRRKAEMLRDWQAQQVGRTCSSCRWWEFEKIDPDHDIPLHIGRCHRNAPMPTDIENDEDWASWIKTAGDTDWCGEHAAREGVDLPRVETPPIAHRPLKFTPLSNASFGADPDADDPWSNISVRLGGKHGTVRGNEDDAETGAEVARMLERFRKETEIDKEWDADEEPT